MKKKFMYFLFCLVLCVSLNGCGSSKGTVNDETNNNTNDNTQKVEDSVESGEESNETTAIVSPLPNDIDINNLDNCTVAISLEEGDAYVDDTGAMQMDVTVYTYDYYDMVDMAALKEGDTIIIRGQEVKVVSLERTDSGLLINGGLDKNGYEFRTDDTTVWYESGYSDMKAYYEVGKTTIRVSADMNFYDSSDLDKGEIMYYPGDFLTDKAGIVYHFVPYNTSIVIEDGKIIKMYRSYMP